MVLRANRVVFHAEQPAQEAGFLEEVMGMSRQDTPQACEVAEIIMGIMVGRIPRKIGGGIFEREAEDIVEGKPVAHNLLEISKQSGTSGHVDANIQFRKRPIDQFGKKCPWCSGHNRVIVFYAMAQCIHAYHRKWLGIHAIGEIDKSSLS